MRLEVRGHPLHTRALAVTLVQQAPPRLGVRGYVLDLRKRGFVPVAGDVQGTGIIHHMTLDGTVDAQRQTLERLVADQPAVAFEPSAATQGESCRDVAAGVAAMAEMQLDDSYAGRLSAGIGGPRGCSHLLTLAQLLGSTVRWALGHGAVVEGHAHRTGERVFRRDVIVDGHEPADGQIELAVQLADLYFAPAAAIARPLERFGRQFELRLHVHLDFPAYAIRSITAAERRRSLADLEDAPWCDRTDAVSELVGMHMAQGATGELLRRYAGRPQQRPLLDALLMIAPTMIQCAAAMAERWSGMFTQSPSIIGMAAFADSCYMWRQGGALDQLRAAGEDPRFEAMRDERVSRRRGQG